MQKALLSIIMITFLAFPFVAVADGDTEEARRAAAERYFTHLPMRDTLDEVVGQMSAHISAAEREQFEDILLHYVRIEKLEAAAKDALVKHLTLDELLAFVEFVEHPAGASAMSKLNHYTADLMPVMQQELHRAAQEYQADKQRGVAPDSSIPAYLRRPQ